MKKSIFISALSIVITLTSVFLYSYYVDKVKIIPWKQNNITPSFQFHYAGKEHYSDTYITYRYNKYTGDIFRYSYILPKTNTDEITVLNFQTGESEVRSVRSEGFGTFRN